MSLKYKGHEKRKREAEIFAQTVINEFSPQGLDLSVKQIAQRHINPKTNRPYSREHIHLILRRAGITK